MPYFSRADAVAVMQVVADEQTIMIHGCRQKATRGDWVVTTNAGKIRIVSDDAFKRQFVKVKKCKP
jgi:hypothetical protein